MSTATTEKPLGTPRPSVPRQPSPFNLANQLTFLRFLLAILLFVQISEGHWLSGLVVFGVASFTDWLDGLAARLLQIGSTLGRNFDPLVDKILICGGFTCFLPYGIAATGLSPWMVVIVISRELLVTSLRSYMEHHHAAFGADWTGKLKMLLQCLGLGAIFVVFAFGENLGRLPAAWATVETRGWLVLIRNGLLWAMTIATVASGLLYLRQAYLIYTRDRQAA